MNTLVQKFKKRLRPIFRREETSIRLLIVSKTLIWANCILNRIRHAHLKALGDTGLKSLSDKRAKNVFVFANGPSLNDLDFTKIKRLVDEKKFDLITVNCFASKGIQQFDIKPSIAVFGDPDHFIGIDGNGVLPQYEEDIKTINDSKIPVMIPDQYFVYSKFKNGIPYCSVRNQYGNNVSNIQKPLGFYSVTAFAAISLAIHLGYKNIYICGYDNSYFKNFSVDQKNRRVLPDQHFYDTEKSAKRYMNPDQYGPISDIFLDFSRHFRYLEKINRLKPPEVTISNIALTTYTDAFPRCFNLGIYND